MLAASRYSTQACLVMISLSIQRLNSDHRDSAFWGFDVYMGATTVTLLNIGNGGTPKNTCQFWGLISFSVRGAQYFGCSGGSHFTLTFFFLQFFFAVINVGLFYLLYISDLSYFISLCLRSLFALGAGFFLLFILLSFTGFGLQILGIFFTLHVWYICGLLPHDVKCALHCGGANHRNTTHTTSGEIVISL
ncbi:hypothetical protein B0H19DRAFT_1203102 [Mycena capillaripes]|nr:hypothetical protein B0H19DRAFT_1203102 [Mycena capillaripes]